MFLRLLAWKAAIWATLVLGRARDFGRTEAIRDGPARVDAADRDAGAARRADCRSSVERATDAIVKVVSCRGNQLVSGVGGGSATTTREAESRRLACTRVPTNLVMIAEGD